MRKKMKVRETLHDLVPYGILMAGSIFFGFNSVDSFDNFIQEKKMAAFYQIIIEQGEEAKEYFPFPESYEQSKETLEAMKDISNALSVKYLESSLASFVFAACCFGSGAGFLMKQKRKKYLESIAKSHRKSMARFY